jgi:hypothetical protein
MLLLMWPVWHRLRARVRVRVRVRVDQLPARPPAASRRRRRCVLQLPSALLDAPRDA